MANVTKWSPEKEAVILEALETKPSYASAARKARISRTTLNRWRREDAAFDARCQQAREAGMDAIEDNLINRGLMGDTTAAIFMLKSWRRERYGDKQETTHKGQILHKHLDLSVYSTDEKLMLDQLLAKQDTAHGAPVA